LAIMRLASVVVFVMLLVAVVHWLVAPAALGRALRVWEALAIAVLGLVCAGAWYAHQARRSRAQLEGLRDSALW